MIWQNCHIASNAHFKSAIVEAINASSLSKNLKNYILFIRFNKDQLSWKAVSPNSSPYAKLM